METPLQQSVSHEPMGTVFIGHAGTFWLYAGLNLVFIAITVALVPETHGVTPEEIERKLMAGTRLRDIGR